MPIRIKPDVGQHLIINKAWMDPNQFFVQSMPNLTPGKVYEILEVDTLDGHPDEWGIVSIKDIETQEIFDVNNFEALEEYWCLFDKNDSIRLVEI